MSGRSLDAALSDLLEANVTTPVRVAIWAGGLDDAGLNALRDAKRAGWMAPLVVGPDAELQRLIRANDSVDAIDIGSWETEEEALQAVLHMASLGEIGALAFPPGDAVATLERLGKVPASPYSLGGAQLGIALVHPEPVDRPLLIADVIAHGDPDAGLREVLVNGAVRSAHALGIETPRVALLAAVEVASPGLPVTMEAQEVAQRFAERTDCFVEGPLSMDLAVSEHAAEKKGAKGNVPGRADILVGPNLTVSRGIYHALARLSGEPVAVALSGGPVPLALPGRGEGPEGLVRSLAFAALLANG